MPKVSSKLINSDRVVYFLEKADRIIKHYGLMDWTVSLDRGLRRAGCCDQDLKRIQLSVHLLTSPGISETDIDNVILHEVAHALVGVEHGHDIVWKNKAIEIGSDGERCHSLVFSRPSKVLLCPCGNIYLTRYRIRSKLLSTVCKICNHKVGVFTENEVESFFQVYLNLSNIVYNTLNANANTKTNGEQH